MTDDPTPSAAPDEPDELDDDLEPDAEPASDDVDDDEAALDPDGFDGQLTAEIGEDGVTYEASDWAGESRALIDALLASEGVPHMWQGTQLRVPVAHEEQVEALIDEVLATATPALDTARDKVVYEVGAWSAALQTSLAESLVVADVPYEWSESGDLMVYADDEERVDEILEAMPDPDDAELADADGLAVQEVLSELFLASSTLARSPDDADAVISLVEHTERLESIAVPFGFEPPTWHALVAKVAALRDVLDLEEPDEDLDDELDLVVVEETVDGSVEDDEAEDDEEEDEAGDADAGEVEVDEEVDIEELDDDADVGLSDDDLRARAAEVRDLIRTYV